MSQTRRILCLLLALSLFVAGTAEAQKKKKKKNRLIDDDPETVQQIMQGVTSSFSLPLRDLLKKEYPSEWRNLFTEFSGGVSYSQPLLERMGPGTGSEGERAFNQAFSASLKWNPLSYWFASINFTEYLDPELQQPWHPDFTYVFGYNDWHPYTFSLVYSNYGGNRLNPDREAGERYTRFEEGSIALGWKFVIPENIQRIFVVHDTGGLGGSLGLSLTPRYTDAVTMERREWKTTLSASFKYTIYKWWYMNFSVFHYPDETQKAPWNPDYTWGFGYFDWHPGTLSIQYNNYSGNRFPWNDPVEGTGRFKDGSVSISWSWTL